MSDRIIQVTAPTRLHCGLLSVHGPGNRFGGAGLMVNQPGLQLTIRAAERFEATGPLSERVRPFVESWMKFSAIRDWPTCRITIERITPAHVGLGTGTQLGLAIAAGLNRWLGLPKLEWTALAASVGRGLRSAIGTYGFHQGGFLVERGKTPDEPLSPLDCRLDIPTEWRFVLLRPTQGEGLSGDAEHLVFATNGSDEEAISQQLREELRLRMVPAMARGDFQSFSEALYAFGHRSGLLFSKEQGGPYNGPVLQGLVELTQRLGVPGIAQSSWGPTLFAVVPSHAAAVELERALILHSPIPLTTTIATPNNAGASIEER